MIKSKDGVVRVDQVSSMADTVFPPSAWSVLNIPLDSSEAKGMFKNLYNSAASRHVSLSLCRHRRKDRVVATSNISYAKDWVYLDTVSIWYERPSTCSNNGLLPIAEPGFLFYKGDSVDTKKTEWFSEDFPNATNLWNLASQEGEGAYSYYQKFSWELNLLLMSMASPLEHSRFIYGVPLSESEYKSLFKFCDQYKLNVQLYTRTFDEAENIIKEYEKR